MIEQNGNILRILVEASGHINFDKCMETDQKGLWKFESNHPLKWKMFKFPVDESILNWQATEEQFEGFPELYTAEF